jgi:flagellar assembly factor FliW
MKEARMQISSTRFGEVEVRDDAVLSFPDGLIGLPGTRYALLGDAPDSPFFWLHSVDHDDVAVPVTNPWLFFDSYEVRVSDEDAARLELVDPADADILCVVRATEQLEDFSVNLAAPVVLHTNNRLGRQIINDAHGYAVREPLFGEVELGDVQATTPRVPVAAQAR